MTAAQDTQVEALKEEANGFFREGAFLKAAAAYTKAMKLDGENAVLYSNRAAAFLGLNKVKQALADADVAIKLRPTWEKGWFRKGCALEAMERFDEAVEAYREANELNPKNAEIAQKIKFGTKSARKAANARGAAPGEDGSGFVRSDEEYAALKETMAFGAAIPASAERVEAFAKRVLNGAINAWVASDGSESEPPVVHFLGGSLDKDGNETAGQVKITGAFDGAEHMEQCHGFLKQYAADIKAHASAVVVHKSQVQFPEPWKKVRGKKQWKLGSQKGFFVQVDSAPAKPGGKPCARCMWFVPADREKGVLVPQDAVPLDWDAYMLVPPIFADS